MPPEETEDSDEQRADPEDGADEVREGLQGSDPPDSFGSDHHRGGPGQQKNRPAELVRRTVGVFPVERQMTSRRLSTRVSSSFDE